MLIHMFGNNYELVDNFKEGWNPEAFRERYSDVLDKFDYIVGDWGYNQLRLKGFYESNKHRIQDDLKIDTVEEYLLEYCNFSCPRFILKKINGKEEETNFHHTSK